VADVSFGGLGECRRSPFDRLLLRTHRQRRHPSALKCEHAPVADHLACDVERFVWRQLAGGLLQRDGVQVAQLEHGMALGEAALDPILGRLGDSPRTLAGEKSQGLVGAELVAAGGLSPHVLQVGAVGELL